MKNSFLPEPLPDAEWDFSQYESEFEITQAFYYEYLRSCKEIHKWIVGGRHFWSSHRSVPNEIKLKMDSAEYFESIKKFPGCLYFDFLCALPEFPNKPLSEYDQLGLEFWLFGNHTSPEGVITYHPSSFNLEIPHSNPIEQVSEDCFSNPFSGKSGFGESVFAFISINWGCTDAELLKDFNDLLRRNRPDRFKGLRKPLKKGLGNRILPFEKSDALNWLSVWRRKENGPISWSQYIELYHPEYNHPNRPMFGKIESKISTLKQQNRKAKKVLRWFAGEKITF